MGTWGRQESAFSCSSLEPVMLCVVLLASPGLRYLFPLCKWGSDILQKASSDGAVWRKRRNPDL